MSPLAVVGSLFWTAVFSTALAFATDLNLRKILARHWKLILLPLIILILWRLPVNGRFFHGLEYEDSYVYTVAGRQLLTMSGDGRAQVSASYSVNVCQIGSLESCSSWESFPEHFMGYPYAIYSLSRIFGYSPEIGSAANVCAACLSDILIFCILILLTESTTMATAGAVVLALTPAFGVYGLETSAEPAANFCVTLCLWFFIRTIAESEIPWRRVIQWLAFSVALLFSLTIKRENALVVIIFAVAIPLVKVGAKLTPKARWILLIGLFATVSIALASCFQMGLIATSGSELKLLKQFPVSVVGFFGFATSFLSSFFVWRWYAGTAFAVLVGTVVCLKRRGVTLLPLLLLVSYIAVYAFHIRSYYEMRAGSVTPSAALRFSMTIMSLWAILAGIGIGAVIIRLPVPALPRFRTVRASGIGLMAGLLAISFFMTKLLRDNMMADENQSRLQPAFAALSAAFLADTAPRFILSLEPLLIQMYGRSDTRVVDLESFDSDDLDSLASSGYLSNAVVINESDRHNDADRARYGSQLRYLRTLPQDVVFQTDSFKIAILRP